jgi:hypothetical protein
MAETHGHSSGAFQDEMYDKILSELQEKVEDVDDELHDEQLPADIFRSLVTDAMLHVCAPRDY